VLELASFTAAAGILEGPKSQPLTVTVTGVAAPASTALKDGAIVTTTDGVRLRTTVLFEELREPSALAVAPNGRTFIGTADGILIVQDGTAAGPPQLTDGVPLAIGLSPDFARDGYVFVTQAIATASAGSIFRTSRVRDMGGWLADRMVILEHGPASAEPSAALRFSADAKLHLAFDDGGNPEAAERMSEWRGKLLRMEADGRTPPDQAAASPVMWRGLTSPRGFDWAADGGPLWLADAARDGNDAGRLRVIVSSGTPRRSSQAASYVLPKGTDATALAFHRGAGIEEFAGNLFVAGRNGSLLRIRFNARDQRPSATETLLEGGVGALRAMAIAADGAIYLCDETRLIRLRRQ
jgi:glucose/arabinose dehydrogenase